MSQRVNNEVIAVEAAPAKLTVHLHVTGVRDDGYHLIDAEMVSLDLQDTLSFSDGDGVEVTGVEARGVPDGTDNLVTRALQLAGRSAHVRLEKCIPHGGGLGGGSSDAAAALRWAGVFDPVVAARVGADVPFCLAGGRARVRGIGEQIHLLPYEERTYTLVLPPFGVSTPAVYKMFDLLDVDGRARKNDINHLETAALMVEPRLIRWRDKLKDLTGVDPSLAGSGSTWFLEGVWSAPDDDELMKARWIVARTTRPIPLG